MSSSSKPVGSGSLRFGRPPDVGFWLHLTSGPFWETIAEPSVAAAVLAIGIRLPGVTLDALALVPFASTARPASNLFHEDHPINEVGHRLARA